MKKKEKKDFLEDLYFVIENRAKSKDKNSYTRSLIKSGKKKISHIYKKQITTPFCKWS